MSSFKLSETLLRLSVEAERLNIDKLDTTINPATLNTRIDEHNKEIKQLKQKLNNIPLKKISPCNVKNVICKQDAGLNVNIIDGQAFTTIQGNIIDVTKQISGMNDNSITKNGTIRLVGTNLFSANELLSGGHLNILEVVDERILPYIPGGINRIIQTTGLSTKSQKMDILIENIKRSESKWDPAVLTYLYLNIPLFVTNIAFQEKLIEAVMEDNLVKNQNGLFYCKEETIFNFVEKQQRFNVELSKICVIYNYFCVKLK